jgi:hypothetical protein
MLGWNNPSVVVERYSEILSSTFNTPMKMHSQCHEVCAADFVRILSMFSHINPRSQSCIEGVSYGSVLT